MVSRSARKRFSCFAMSTRFRCCPQIAAYLATIGEHVFSVLLLIGLASRLSALGLFGMTMVIQLFVFPDSWPEHILWVALELVIVSRGPGAVSLDHLIWTRRPALLVAAR
jgi:putative oxidoreductase